MIRPNHLLRRTISRTIADYKMFVCGDKVLIGASGGPDSTLLVHMLWSLADELEITMGICYLDHGLRPEAAKEAAFVQKVATDLHVEYHQGRARIESHRGSIEEQARIARYHFLRRTAQAHGYTKIAVAHQAEDNAELVLMHLLRGSGLRGLSGIPPVGAGGIVRPLINCRRADIMAYLLRHGVTYMTDESNADRRFMRNRIRHELIPLLKKNYNPNVIQTLNRTSGLFRQEEQWRQQASLACLSKISAYSNPQGFGLYRDKLAEMETGLQRRVVREALRNWQGHIKRLTADHVAAVLHLAVCDGCGRRLHLPNRVLVEQTPDLINFSMTTQPRRAIRPESPGFCCSIASAAQLPVLWQTPLVDYRLQFSITTPDKLTNQQPCEEEMVVLDLNRLTFPLVIRSIRAGDRIRPFGMNGSQKIADLLINRKIPKHQRAGVALVISAQDIIWVAGLRRSALAPLSASTTEVLQIECLRQ